MDRRRFVAGLGAVGAGALLAGATYQRRRRIFFFADSFSGYALGRRQSTVLPYERLYAFSAPHRTINLLAEENELNIRCRNIGMSGYVTSGPCLPAQITAAITSYNIGAEDWIVVSDAGDHGSNPAAFQTAAQNAFTAFKAAGAPVFAMTMFDYTDGTLASSSTKYQWDFPFGGTTINQALQTAASAVGGINVIDMNAAMDTWRVESIGRTGADPMRMVLGGVDGVHPGVWGQLYYVGEFLRALGLASYFSRHTALKAIAAANYMELAAGSASWTRQDAEDYVDLCLAPDPRLSFRTSSKKHA